MYLSTVYSAFVSDIDAFADICYIDSISVRSSYQSVPIVRNKISVLLNRHTFSNLVIL